MSLNNEQIRRLADTALTALIDRGGATLKVERGQAIAKIVAVVEADQQIETALDRQAEKLLAAHLRGGSGDVDERKLFTMIKKKLADDQGYPL